MSALVTLATAQTITGAKTSDTVLRVKSTAKVRPQSSGGIASVEFFQNPDEYLHEVGDLWRVGTALEANNARNL